MKRILITGATGFAGSHLVDLYLRNHRDYQIHCIKRRRANIDYIKHVLLDARVQWHDVDITDAHAVEALISRNKFDVIHHLAAQSFVPASWTNPSATFETNVIGSLHIIEAVKNTSKDTIIQIASSSEIYGIPLVLPITEESLPEPCSPYAVSKLALDRLAAQYHKSYGIKTVITRGFNHTGPRRGAEFVCSTFAKQIAEIEKNSMLTPCISVGNLSAVRDFTDVRDMVKAYELSVERCKYGTPYNICSGRKVSIQWILDELLKLSSVNVDIMIDHTRMRPSDLHTLQGDASKFITDTGWTREYKLEETLKDLLTYWRENV
jgi:GDP-4-dehydro-6-deoxy-D-mannose reductase